MNLPSDSSSKILSIFVAVFSSCWNLSLANSLPDSFITLGSGCSMTQSLDLGLATFDDSPTSHGSDRQVHVPEPLLFDLVRPLGARKGELEFNTLAVFPWKSRNRNVRKDPFGSGTTSPDRGGIEWAPELEYAITDNFAIEFEFPFEGSSLEEYKLGLQWTFENSFDKNYIHGIQFLVEPTTEWQDWNSTLLYLAGYRFDETWSTLAMVGGRMNLAGSQRDQSIEGLVNLSVFADVNESTKLGLEINYSRNITQNPWSLIAIPQIHYDLTNDIQLQSGLGFGTFGNGHEYSFVSRLIFQW